MLVTKEKVFKRVALAASAIALCAMLVMLVPTLAFADVSKGNTYGNVAAVQARLKTYGYYSSTVDGTWGANTTAAVKRFQTAMGLTSDGVVGGATERALSLKLPVSGGISKGKTAANIAALQARLKTRGYYRSTVDGKWGNKTLGALLSFPSDKGLTVDGVAGGATERALGVTLKIGERTGGVSKGRTTENVKKIQTALKNAGYYRSTVDGVWGRNTMCAVMAFQSDKGLTVDGVVGGSTERALGVSLASGSNTGSNIGTGSVGNISQSDLDLLARCVYGEARGEPYTGQVAIAAVVLNRVRSSKFPNTISGVIYQRGAFTAVSDGQINLTPNETAYKAAREALGGHDPTGGCLYYYNPATATSSWIWTLTVHLRIGRHNFAL